MSLENKAIEFLKNNRPERQMEDDLTVEMAADYWKMHKNQASELLARKVKAGELIKIRGILESGRMGNIFRII